MKIRTTPKEIKKLKKNEVFVFGSNKEGNHIGGAAKLALDKFGAKSGQGEGLQGHSYAIPTMDGIKNIGPAVDRFIGVAKDFPTWKFFVTEIGCGIAGFKPEQIAPLFFNAAGIENIFLPASFWEIIETALVKKFESRFGKLVGGKCGGDLYLSEYAHPLPSGFTGCGGYLYLSEYAHPLPSGFTGCGGDLYLSEYAHPLPSGFTGCGGYLYLRNYAHPLPSGFTGCGGDLDLRNYAHPLPSGFTGCGGYLDLSEYAHPLPSGFTGCGGDLYLSEYAHPLPSGFVKGKYSNHQRFFDFELKSVVFLPTKEFLSDGAIRVYKKIKRWGLPAIVTLLIPAEAKRCHGTGQRKCRAAFAKVEDITIVRENIKNNRIVNYAYAPHVEYKVGEIVYPDKYDGRDTECSHGINFFMTKVEAEKY